MMSRDSATPKRSLHRAAGAEGDRAAYGWLSTSDVVDRMGGTRQKVIDLIHAGAFGFGPRNVVRWGREYRVHPEALDRYLESHAVQPAKAS